MSEIAIYEGPGGRVEVHVDRETVWLSLDKMAELFGRDKSVISRHLRNVFKDEELERSAVVANFATTAADGKTYQVDHYNLDAILSVEYRVNSKQGTRFRQWSNRVLSKHLTRGYTLNRHRLEQNARELKAALRLMQRTASNAARTTDQGQGLVNSSCALNLARFEPIICLTTPATPLHGSAPGGLLFSGAGK